MAGMGGLLISRRWWPRSLVLTDRSVKMPSISLGNFKTHSTVKLTYYLLVMCGMMNQEGRPWTLIIAAYFTIMLMLFGTFSAAKAYMEIEDFNEFIQPCAVSIAAIHLIGKFVNILVKQTKIRNLLNRLEQLRQQELEDPVYASHFTKADNFIKALIFYTYVFILLVPVISLLFNIFNDYLSAAEEPSLIVPMWLPWNYQKSWPYAAALITSTVIIFSVAALFSTFCALLFTITFELSTMLRVLQAKLEVNKANDKSIFLQHINILQMLQQVNELFSGQYYLETLMSSIQPCGFCYMLIKNLKSGDSRWLDLFYKFLIALSAPLWLCACGEEINTQIQKLHESSYRGPWYEEQPIVRKQLLILMTVTSRPLTFNYRGLITFNLLCFAKVVQGFYSYITMLSNLGTND